jgi:hypothetical protein
LIGVAVDALWSRLGWAGVEDETLIRFPWLPATVGALERILYFFAFLMGKPEFIAVWLALKVAGQWSQWSEQKIQLEKKWLSGRAIFQVFLIGNALSIIVAVAIAYAVIYASYGKEILALGYASAAYVFLIAFAGWHKSKSGGANRKDEV